METKRKIKAGKSARKSGDKVVKNVFQFKIYVKGVKPKVWRRIQVPEHYSFSDLHRALQCAFGWHDTHMHKFWAINPQTGMKDCLGMVEEESEHGMFMRNDVMWESIFGSEEKINEGTAKISSYFLFPNDKAIYMYDFGDRWIHVIILEKISQADPNIRYPKCIDGERAGIPEDCGGPSGFANHLKIIQNPSHPDHKDRKNWTKNVVCASLNPAAFKPENVDFHVNDCPIS